MDKIIVKDLEVFYRVGVPDTERSKPQRLLLTVEMGHDLSWAAQSDELRHSIDYHAVSQRLLNFGEGRNWKLIEALATSIADAILAEFKPQSVLVEVKKFAIPAARYVSVKVARARKDLNATGPPPD